MGAGCAVWDAAVQRKASKRDKNRLALRGMSYFSGDRTSPLKAKAGLGGPPAVGSFQNTSGSSFAPAMLDDIKRCCRADYVRGGNWNRSDKLVFEIVP